MDDINEIVRNNYDEIKAKCIELENINNQINISNEENIKGI